MHAHNLLERTRRIPVGRVPLARGVFAVSVEEGGRRVFVLSTLDLYDIYIYIYTSLRRRMRTISAVRVARRIT